MKCIVIFLVLSMVVLMAEPGEGFLGTLLHGAVHVSKILHGIMGGDHGVQEQEEQLDKRSTDYNSGRPGFS
ncbi:pleurocidin-like peptide WF3 [Micropterus dolomieu]|uniref:pleurocidin-like peptide WF3 n=1 Tax=Micropterus dolomieu TaxID=147949 RepID=UPI001E8DEB68|nr:pleurocidin-like peptide WF3 [Micropterus dolomieu]